MAHLAPCHPAAAFALSFGCGAVGSGADLEDRARCRAARPPRRDRLRDPGLFPVVRYPATDCLCVGVCSAGSRDRMVHSAAARASPTEVACMTTRMTLAIGEQRDPAEPGHGAVSART